MIRKKCGFGTDKRIKKNRDKEKLIFLAGFILLLAFLILQLAARRVSGFGEWYAVTIYPLLTGSIGRFFGMFPFSVSEIGLYLLLIACFLYGVCHLTAWRRILNRAFFLVSLLLFLYTINCGINYYRQPFSQFLDYRIGTYSAKDLKALLAYLTEQVNQADVQRCEGGTDITAESVKAMKKLGAKYPVLHGFYPGPKALLFSRVLSVQQLSGIYSPFTIEANYNGEMTPYNIPHTVCHELSHLRGFMREDEANFIGFLACIDADSPEFRYSGYLAGWIYAGNALAAEDPESYAGYWEALNENIKAELNANSLFWDRFDTKTAEVAEAINDTYLKANSQTDGVKSYGRAVDLILAWYHQ